MMEQLEHTGSPKITSMRVIPVAGRDSSLPHSGCRAEKQRNRDSAEEDDYLGRDIEVEQVPRRDN